MKKESKFKMLLQKCAPVVLFAIALFSVILVLPTNTNAANFEYKDFDWDTFYEQSKTYWDHVCDYETDAKAKEKCETKILKLQKKFYTRLYKLLAKYQAKYGYSNKADDRIIIETVFFGVMPSNIDGGEGDGNSEDYKNFFQTFIGAFNFDDNVSDDEIEVEPDFSGSTAAKDYYKNETDTLQTLIRNMYAYTTNCIGVVGDIHVEEVKNPETGEIQKIESCPDGGTFTYIDKYGGYKCADQIGTYELGFWEYYVSKYAHDEKLNLFQKVIFFGLKFIDDKNWESCKNYGAGYNEMYYQYNDRPQLSTYQYFEYLKTSDYYDKKAHLQSYFKETVLEPANAKCMTKDLCGDKSLEALGKFEEYQTEIYQVRSEINLEIIGILTEYGVTGIDWPGGGNVALMDFAGEASRNGMWWPIGSSATENKGGIVFASGDPAPTTITSPFGMRLHPISGTYKMHNGIDIAGPSGTNIIASSNGQVTYVNKGCVAGNMSCGGGYGNYIIITHGNGDQTLYAHLLSVSVNNGDTVQQGQVIGKMGTTGSSTGNHLHYEVIVGGSRVDPLQYVSPDNPRPVGAAGDFSVHETTLTKEEFMQKLAHYCATHSCDRVLQSEFVLKAGTVYDVSIANNVNPELVVVRAIVEGFSPHKTNGSNNHWGIRCYNGAGIGACSKYNSLEDGIRGFANTVASYSMASDMMSKYAYIGAVWYNPGSWSNGGCIYFPYIREFMSAGRAATVEGICGGPKCSGPGAPGCTSTNAEDQQAYATWQVNKKMAPLRYNIFGL